MTLFEKEGAEPFVKLFAWVYGPGCSLDRKGGDYFRDFQKKLSTGVYRITPSRIITTQDGKTNNSYLIMTKTNPSRAKRGIS